MFRINDPISLVGGVVETEH